MARTAAASGRHVSDGGGGKEYEAALVGGLIIFSKGDWVARYRLLAQRVKQTCATGSSYSANPAIQHSHLLIIKSGLLRFNVSSTNYLEPLIRLVGDQFGEF